MVAPSTLITSGVGGVLLLWSSCESIRVLWVGLRLYSGEGLTSLTKAFSSAIDGLSATSGTVYGQVVLGQCIQNRGSGDTDT
jgi:hypothetical protein